MKRLCILVPGGLHDQVKAAGNHGIITRICTYGLEQYLMDQSRDGDMPADQLEQLNTWRADHVAKTERCGILNGVLDGEIWSEYHKILIEKGLTRRISAAILKDLKIKLYSQYSLVPSDRELKPLIKDWYERKVPEMDQIRCELFKVECRLARAEFVRDQELKETLAAMKGPMKEAIIGELRAAGVYQEDDERPEEEILEEKLDKMNEYNQSLQTAGGI